MMRWPRVGSSLRGFQPSWERAHLGRCGYFSSHGLTGKRGESITTPPQIPNWLDALHWFFNICSNDQWYRLLLNLCLSSLEMFRVRDGHIYFPCTHFSPSMESNYQLSSHSLDFVPIRPQLHAESLCSLQDVPARSCLLDHSANSVSHCDSYWQRRAAVRPEL